MIRSISSLTGSTFEASNDPCRITPNPFWPAGPRVAAPEASVLRIHVLTHLEQAIRIDEVRELDFTLLLQFDRTSGSCHHLSIAVDDDGCRFWRDGDRGIKQAACLSRADYQLAIGIDIEVTGPRVEKCLSNRIGNLDKTGTFDSDIQAASSVL